MPSLFVVAALVATAAGCHRGAAPTAPTALAGRAALAADALALVPADTPYAFVSLAPLPAATRAQMMSLGPEDLLDALAPLVADSESTGGRMAAQLARELRDGDRLRGWRELGFSDTGGFAFYGLSLWPVVRFAVADGSLLRGVTARVLGAAGPDVQARTTDGITYWVAAITTVSVVVAILDREAVIALVPTPAVDHALPLLLGTARPARSLAQAGSIADVARDHGLITSLLGFVDVGAVVRRLVEDGTGLDQELGAPWRRADGDELASCGDDLRRIAAVFPRLVFGYRRLDERGFAGGLYLDSPTPLGAALSGLRTSIPALAAPAGERPLMAGAIAVDVDGALAWARATAAALREHPLQCAALGPINELFDQAADALASPLPPMAVGLRGGAFVLDDLVKDPPAGAGALVVVGSPVAALVSALWTQPLLAGTPAPALGIPVALPVAQLGLRSVPSAHLAQGGDRLALAVGAGSLARAGRALSAPGDKRAPLATFTMDLVRARARGLLDDDDRRLRNVEQFTFSLDASARGLVLGFECTWAPPSGQRPALARP